MKLLNVRTARAIWLFDIRDMNPEGRNVYPELIDWIREHYHFEKFPKTVLDVDPRGGWIFGAGTFPAQKELSLWIELSIYADGLVANTQSSTKATEQFLTNTLESARKNFGLVFDQSMIRKRLYLSEIEVRTEGSLSRINPALEQFAQNKISPAVGLDDAKPGFHFIGISFGSDLSYLPSPENLISGFSFERKTGSPFSENRFYSKAPLPTEKHMEILHELENSLV